MKTSDKGVKFLTELEGAVLVPYKDSAGVWTIGVGHTISAGPPDPKTCAKLTEKEVSEIFQNDLGKFEARVAKAITQPMKQHEFDAFVSFDFNTGAIHKATLTKKFNAGDKQGCADGFMSWTRAGNDKNALRMRRSKEQKLFLSGDYDEPFEIAVWDKWPGTPRKVTA